MQNIKESALSTCRQTIPLWLRCVDDTFTAVRHDWIDAFHHHPRQIILQPTSHKATSLRTLTRRAQLVCNTTDSLSDENKYLENTYNEDFIQCNTHRPATTTEANDNATPSTTATIPYTKGISENISHILQPFNNCVAHKPYTILRQLLTHVKDKDDPRNRKGAVYKISCSDCRVSYIGETSKNLTTRLTERKRAKRKRDVNNHIAEHHRLTNHTIDWDSAQCLTYSTNYFQRLTLESWFTNLEQTQQVSTTNGTIQKTHLRH